MYSQEGTEQNNLILNIYDKNDDKYMNTKS